MKTLRIILLQLRIIQKTLRFILFALRKPKNDSVKITENP